MDFSNEMIFSLTANALQLVASVIITYMLARHSNRSTFFIILWLVYDAIVHFTLVSTAKASVSHA